MPTPNTPGGSAAKLTLPHGDPVAVELVSAIHGGDLDGEELTILTAWAEGVSEAAQTTPEGIDALLAEARPDATWRAELGLPQPSPRLSEALESLERLARGAATSAGMPPCHALLTEAAEDHPGEETLDRLVRHVLLAMLEERATRQPEQAKSPH